MGSAGLMTMFGLLLLFVILIVCPHSSYGLTGVPSSVHCAVRREISPCTCRYQEPTLRSTKMITVTCERMTSFQQVVSALQGKFEANVDIALKISYSALDDLPQLSFQQMGITIHKLHLNHDNLSALPESVFSGLGKAELLSLADNGLITIPQTVLRLMPKVKTLDLGRGRLANITATDFQGLNYVSTLILSNNNVTMVETNSLPLSVTKLHLGQNKLKTLNGTLRNLIDLEWLFLNGNYLENLEGELPLSQPNKKMTILHVGYNKLKSVPQELKEYVMLENLFLENNEITKLEGALSKAARLKSVILSHNRIELLEADDFAELSYLETMDMSHNNITSLNESLLPLKSLRSLDLSHNQISEFSPSDVRGLVKLMWLDLSYNNISHLTIRMENAVENDAKVFELRLEYNVLKSLSGALRRIGGLHRVNVSHNHLESLGPMDLEGLDNLHILDISHNRLLTLAETGKTVVPSLEELIASYNLISYLEKDFQSFPQLCWVDLSHNLVEDLSSELADYTQCRLHGVNSTLRIYLQGNVGLCKAEIAAKIVKMESRNNTKVHGLTECGLPNGGPHGTSNGASKLN